MEGDTDGKTSAEGREMNGDSKLRYDNKTEVLSIFMARTWRYAESLGGATMKNVAQGNLGSIPDDASEELYNHIHTHLVVWQKQKLDVDSKYEEYETDELDEQGDRQRGHNNNMYSPSTPCPHGHG